MSIASKLAGAGILAAGLAGCWGGWHGMGADGTHMGNTRMGGGHMGGSRQMGMGGGWSDPVARGGRGYDKWWVEYALPEPADTHPSYPATGKASGSATWRCKECHGWDYLGADGAYGRGSHATGISGVIGAMGRSPQSIASTLRDDTHRYQTVLPDTAISEIARFISEGQIRMAAFVDSDGKARGDASAGRRTFDDYCAGCHGRDGREIDFNEGGSTPETLGTVAGKNPWEALHKLRNGQPGESGPNPSARTGSSHHHDWMPPMRQQLGPQEQADLLSHLQTLPDG